MITDENGDLWITGKNAKVFDGDFDKLLDDYKAPYVYTKDIPEFIRLKNEHNAKVESGEIAARHGFKPYFRLDYIEIETCQKCSGDGCDRCYGRGWDVRARIIFDGVFSKVLSSYLSPYVYTEDISEFIKLKNEHNAGIESDEAYYSLNYIEIETCWNCSGTGCDKCRNVGWRTVEN